MSVLWAPWRMEYILSDKDKKGCIFCIGDDRTGYEERLILYAGPMSIVMMNRFPYNNGHLLVAPVRHTHDLGGLSSEESLDLILTVRKAVEILREEMSPEGLNVGLNLGKAAGAGVEDHIHFHVVPRWNGDTNFMTVAGEVRVIPEHIRETYKKLKPYFEKF
ncbi:MAG: HIT domain-containing protein [Deltaproteobacteria bacterium]|nr:HIT domain-containing protein [Deltaproteobacteria bacterium]